MNRKDLKKSAKAALAGKWNWAAALMFLTVVISSISVAALFGVGIVVAGMISISLSFAFLNLLNNHQRVNYYSAMFTAFSDHQAMPVFINLLLTSIFTFLWSLLFVIPGIVKGLAYSQSFFIIKEARQNGQTLAPSEAITKSRQMMNGHKWEFFVLQLSFLGWDILACLTLGIGFFWLIPYIETTNAAYYRQLSKQDTAKPVEA